MEEIRLWPATIVEHDESSLVVVIIGFSGEAPLSYASTVAASLSLMGLVFPNRHVRAKFKALARRSPRNGLRTDLTCLAGGAGLLPDQSDI